MLTTMGMMHGYNVDNLKGIHIHVERIHGGCEFIEALVPKSEDTIVWKHRYSAFVQTDFDQLLSAHGIETLVIMGINTNTCVESTLRDAHFLGYHVVLVKDATACAFDDVFEASILNVERHFGIVAEAIQVIEHNKGE